MAVTRLGTVDLGVGFPLGGTAERREMPPCVSAQAPSQLSHRTQSALVYQQHVGCLGDTLPDEERDEAAILAGQQAAELRSVMLLDRRRRSSP